VQGLADVIPAAFGPVSEGAQVPSDYQLGWSLWGVLLLGAAGALIRRNSFGLVLLFSVIFLLLLLLPVPYINHWLWFSLPQAVCNLTFLWPMQRFYPILAALSIFLGYLACSHFIVRRLWLQLLPAAGLVFALVWSAGQAGPFLRRGHATTAGESVAALTHLPQNIVLTRYAYSPFAQTAAYFSHGYVDPVWEQRLLSADSLREVNSNYLALMTQTTGTPISGEIKAWRGGPQSRIYSLIGALPVEPGRHYALEFQFNEPELTGDLLVTGPTIKRNYGLPNSGGGMPISHPSTAFGSLPSSKHAFPIFTSATKAESLQVLFVTSDLLARDSFPFGHYTLKEYNPAALPVFVETWSPYRALVTSPERGWLETPRIFIEGYRALVNGQPAEVARSPDGLVMIPVPAGQSRVKLTYPGPLSLRISYYLSLAAWISVIVAGGCVFFRRQPARTPARAFSS
jgi:hypothetical protein